MVKWDACLHQDGFRVAIAETSERQLRAWSKEKRLLCPACKAALVYRRGVRVAAHFAHQAHCIPSGYEPESSAHRNGKLLVAQWLGAQFPHNETSCEAVIEETGQRADVLTIFPGGKRVAVEVQCSPLPRRELAKRMRLYKTARIGQLWLLDWRSLGQNNGGKDGSIKLSELALLLASAQNDRLYLLDIERAQIGYVRLPKAVQGRKRLVEPEAVWKRKLAEVSLHPSGRLDLREADRLFAAAQLRQQHEAGRRRAWEKRLVDRMAGWLIPEHVQSFFQRRAEQREQHPLFAVVSVFYRPAEYPLMQMFEQRDEGDMLFKLDPFLWQSFLFFTEIYRSYSRSSTFSRGRRRPKLFVKRLIHSAPGRADRIFKEQVIDKWINRPLQAAKRIAPEQFAAVKDVHELIYDYLCSLAELGFLRNVTPNQATITANGKLFGTFEVLFDRFYPERFQTNAAIRRFFQQHRLQFVWQEWYDVRTGERFR